MKSLTIVLIVCIALARRHHRVDPVTDCLENTCKEQFDACDNDESCVSQLEDCVNVQLNNWQDIEAGLDCLNASQTAADFITCVAENCVGIHEEEGSMNNVMKTFNKRH